jgi:uroporphyrinogen decarboxylase
MEHIERFYATVERKTVDRPCSWLGLPAPAAQSDLLKHFSLSSVDELILKLDDDIFPVDLPYHSPVADAIWAAFDFAKKGKIDIDHRTLNSPGFFENMTDPARVNDFPWPDPSMHIDPAQCRSVVENAPKDRVVLAMVWSAHFQDACSAFGMESALVQMYSAPDMFRAVIDRVLEFYLKANEIFYEATKGKVDAVVIGNDFGAQTGLMLSPEKIREFVFPGTRKLVTQAKSYGLKVIHHSCGSIRPIINDLIELGVDVIHPIQALAVGMEPGGLKSDFGNRVSFCGGIDAQDLMVHGTPRQVRDKVRELRQIFPTGLIISPSHEAIPGTPPENIDAMFQAIRERM